MFRQVEPKIVDIDNEWLVRLKGVFHIISMILLLLYAFMVWKKE